MAELFGVTVPNVSYHFKRIFTSEELKSEMVVKEILTTVHSGARGLSEEKVKYYNLDAILSLGYRVNSVQATAFRKWFVQKLHRPLHMALWRGNSKLGMCNSKSGCYNFRWLSC